jgi:hypothetical protein
LTCGGQRTREGLGQAEAVITLPIGRRGDIDHGKEVLLSKARPHITHELKIGCTAET